MRPTASSATIIRLVQKGRRSAFHAPSEDVPPVTWSLKEISRSRAGTSITKST